MNIYYKLISILVLLFLVSLAYVSGVFERFSGTESSEVSWVNQTPESMSSSPVAPEPSASNVSNDYYSKVQDLEKYLEQNPSDTTHLLRLARLYSEAHQLNKAIDTYEIYRRLRPEELQTYLDLANLYGATGNWDSALEVTDILLKVSPKHDKAQYNRAAILANMGDRLQAEEQWKAILTASKDSTIISLSRAALEKLSVSKLE